MTRRRRVGEVVGSERTFSKSDGILLLIEKVQRFIFILGDSGQGKNKAL